MYATHPEYPCVGHTKLSIYEILSQTILKGTI